MSEITAPDGVTDDDASLEEASVSARHDYQPTNTAKKKRGRPPKVRHDSPAQLTPINGWGEPFKVELKPGWEGFWASAPDQARLGHIRSWELATWGDPRVIAAGGAAPGKKGQPITYRETSLMLMSSAAAQLMRAGDPRKQQHSVLRSELRMDAQNSGDSRYRGRFVEHQISPMRR